jgi:hypothetical protein
MDFTMVLDPAAKARHGTMMSMRATNRKRAAPTLAPVSSAAQEG